jgi:hypothetical protein
MLTPETFAVSTHPVSADWMVEFGQKTQFACRCLTLFYLQIMSTFGSLSRSLTKALTSPKQMGT